MGERRHGHRQRTFCGRAVREAVRCAGVIGRATSHTFRYSFATHLLEDGCHIRTVQSRLRWIGHKDVKTTMVYTHVLQRSPLGVRSPADGLQENGVCSLHDIGVASTVNVQLYCRERAVAVSR